MQLGRLRRWRWPVPQHIASQMMAVLFLSFLLLLAIMAAFEFRKYAGVAETAASDFTARRLQRLRPILESIPTDQVAPYLERVSHCHDGYTVSATPYSAMQPTAETAVIKSTLAERIAVDEVALEVGNATLWGTDFAYRECASGEMRFPLAAMVVSLRLAPDLWLNAEVHQHEWHLTPNMADWLIRSLAAFCLIGGIALLFVYRLTQPFKRLADAANDFASELEVNELEETGPPDVRRAIQSFNQMQRQVSGEMERRMSTLAAISHDIRTPLTALRVKSELIDDEELRADHIASIDKLEKITASALDFLRGESRNEPRKLVNLGELVDSACAEFQEHGAIIHFDCPKDLYFNCRPNALVRAISNLLGNALKYAGSAQVDISATESMLSISVADNGPGIPEESRCSVRKPFERLDNARESSAGGFGLGLAIVDAIANGHDGHLVLLGNSPSGLIARLELPTVLRDVQ